MSKLKIEYNCELDKKQINYAFQRLITSLSISNFFEEYKEDKELINKLLKMVIEWKIKYDSDNTLSFIKNEELDYIDSCLYDLDGKHLSTKGIYLEDAYIWFEQLDVLYNKEKKLED